MLVVFDTNVIISAILSPNGKPAEVFKRYLAGEFTLCCDERILREYELVLNRPKFGFRRELVVGLMNFIRTNCLLITPTPINTPFADDADKKFFEVAKFCNAALITGNRKHFPEDSLIKSVHEI